MPTPVPASSVTGGSSAGGGGVQSYYDIDFKVDDFDLKMNLESVRILGSIWSVYHTVIVKFRLDSLEILENELYGQKECKITIKEMTEDKELLEQHELDLVVINSYSSGLPKRSNASEQEKHHALHDYHMYVCVPKKPYENMTQIINYLAQDTDAKSPYDAANDLINKYIKDSQKELLDKNKNDTKLYQIAIPPQPFSSAMDYLNSRYAIFNGPMFYANWFMDDTFCLWDLSKKIEENEEYTIHVLARGDKAEEDAIKEASEDSFYTYSNLRIKNNSGNMPAVKATFENVFVLKPRDALYKIQKYKFDEVFQSNAPKTGSDLFVHDSVKKTKSVWSRNIFSAPEDGMASETSNIAMNMLSASEIFFSLDRNLKFKNLLKYGTVIDLITEVADYVDYQGKYLVQTVHLHFSKNRAAYIARCDLSCIRSNIKHGGASAGGGV